MITRRELREILNDEFLTEVVQAHSALYKDSRDKLVRSAESNKAFWEEISK